MNINPKEIPKCHPYPRGIKKTKGHSFEFLHGFAYFPIGDKTKSQTHSCRGALHVYQRLTQHRSPALAPSRAVLTAEHEKGAAALCTDEDTQTCRLARAPPVRGKARLGTQAGHAETTLAPARHAPFPRAQRSVSEPRAQPRQISPRGAKSHRKPPDIKTGFLLQLVLSCNSPGGKNKPNLGMLLTWCLLLNYFKYYASKT